MADTVSIALVGALLFTLTLVPVLASYWFKGGVKEHANKVFDWVKDWYSKRLAWCLRHRRITIAAAVVIFSCSLALVPFIGGEFMPHLDEGALWVRATMPYTISFEESSEFAPGVRTLLMSYPQVTVGGSELGRPDDGTDPTGFFNCEFYVGLKPYNDKAWDGKISSKAKLIEDLQDKLKAYPGVIFNYTQPAEDAVDEALTGLKSSLAVKIFGPDLATLESKAEAVQRTMATVPGITHISLVRELGQPSLSIEPDREKLARYGLNVADINALIETAVGGTPATQVIQGERSFDLVVRLQEPFRENMDAIKDLLVTTPDGQHLP